MIFLDTHVVAWLYEGALSKIPKTIQELLNEGELIISPMVELELDFLYEIKRIKAKGSHIINELDAHLGLEVSRIDFYRVVKEVQHLIWTRDPFDRLIVANAMIFQAPLITKNKVIGSHYELAKWSTH